MTAQRDTLETLQAENATLRAQLASAKAALHTSRDNGDPSESFARRVLNNLFAFVGVLLPDGTLIEANQAPLNAAGIAFEDVAGRKFWDCYWWSYSAEVQARLRDAVERANRGEVVRYDVPVRMAGDTRMWIDFQLSPLRDDAGNITHLIPSGIDLSARRQAEEKLLAAKQHLDALINQNIAAIAEMDLNGNYTMVNDRYCALTGYTRAELLAGMSMQMITHADDMPRSAEVFRRLAEEGVPFAVEKRYIRKDGSVVWVRKNASAVYDAAGKRQSIVAMMEDITERRQAEEKIRQQTQIINLSYEPSIVWSLDDGILEWNAGAEHLYGYTRDEALGSTTHTLLRTQHANGFAPFIEQLKREGHWSGELRHTTKAGQTLIVESRHQWIEVDGQPFVLEINRDITARKAAEAALQESELRFSRLAEANIIGIITADVEKIITSNDAFLRMVGYTREDLEMGRVKWPEMTPAEFVELDQRGMAQLLERGWCEPFEKEYFRKDGSRVSILLGAALLTHEPLTWICYVIDLTERKHTAERLQLTNFRFRMAEEAANSFSYEWDIDADVVERSAGLQKVLGYAPEELSGRWDSWANLMHPNDRTIFTKEHATHYLNALPNDNSSGEYRVRHKDGSYRWMHESSMLLRDAHGRVRRMIGQAVDITERKRAEEALRESEARYRELSTTLETRVAERTAELAQSREQLRALSAYVLRAREDERARIAREVHDELGGALTVLKMSLARLMRNFAGDAAFEKGAHDMRAQIDELVQNVRRIATDLRPSILDDFGLVAAMEWQAQEWGQRTGIECQMDASLMPADLEIDDGRRTALFRVFQEALTNVARHAHATHVLVTLSLADGRLVLSVQDDGRGMDVAGRPNGTSLGLAGMRERIREVGGDFAVASMPGRGTTVRVQVPLQSN